MFPNLHVLTVAESPERSQRAKEHFDSHGIPFKFFRAINWAKWGLTTRHTYEVDHPGSGYRIADWCVCLHLSHYMMWRKFQDMDGDVFTIAEDDCVLNDGWKENTKLAFQSVPNDWDMLYLGSCNCGGKPQKHIAGNVYEIKEPHCTHLYSVRKKALQTLIETQEDAWAPVDLSLAFRAHPLLKVYTVLPRIADQFNTVINP